MKLRPYEWLWIILAIGFVWFAEAFNTAIERVADAITLDQNSRIGAAKDMAAAGVLFSSTTAFLIGLIVFGPHIMTLVR